MSDEKQVAGDYLLPNMDSYGKEMERIQKDKAEREARRGNRGADKLFWYQWKDGENNLIILPPWNPETREVFKRVYTMYNLPPDKENHQCVEKTHPELNLKCPIYAVLQEAKDKGQKVGRQFPVVKNYWQVLDIDGIVQTVKVKDKDGNETEKQIDFRFHPQILALPPSAHDPLFSYFYSPDTAMFTDPRNAVPFDISRVIGANSIPTYTVKPLTNFAAGKKVVVRMPIADSAAEILEIVGKVVEGKLEGSKLFDLDNIFKAPLKALEPDGTIFKCAQKMRRYYQLDVTAPLTHVTGAPPYIPPGTAGVLNVVPPGMENTASPTVAEEVAPSTPVEVQADKEPGTVVTATPTDPEPQEGGTTYKKPKDMNTPEDKLEGGAPAPVAFPGSPNCFGTHATTSTMKATMKDNQYSNGVLLPDPNATGSPCALCPYAAVCMSMTPQ